MKPKKIKNSIRKFIMLIDTLINFCNLIIKLLEFTNIQEAFILFIILFFIYLYYTYFISGSNYHKIHESNTIVNLIEKLIDNKNYENAANLLKSYFSHKNIKIVCGTVIAIVVIICVYNILLKWLPYI